MNRYRLHEKRNSPYPGLALGQEWIVTEFVHNNKFWAAGRIMRVINHELRGMWRIADELGYETCVTESEMHRMCRIKYE